MFPWSLLIFVVVTFVLAINMFTSTTETLEQIISVLCGAIFLLMLIPELITWYGIRGDQRRWREQLYQKIGAVCAKYLR